MKKNKVTVRVHGLEYTVIGTEEPEYMKRVAAYVDRRMEEIEYMGKMGEQKLSMLTALNLTDELFKAKEDLAVQRREMMELQRTIRSLERKNQKEEKTE